MVFGDVIGGMESGKLNLGIMNKRKELSFISDDKLIDIISRIVYVMENSKTEIEKKIFTNGIDVFSAMFDAFGQKINLSQWLKQECSIKSQKTLQNHIGLFHQAVLGSMENWEDLGTGNIVDIRNKKKKIFAEIKNKYNTTKGNHKTAIYDDFKSSLSKKEYEGYTGYYIEIIPKNCKRYNMPFVPSDNKTSSRRQVRENIRRIDGYSFYELASGEKDALIRLYRHLPELIGWVMQISPEYVSGDPLFEELFYKAYQQE